MTETGQNPLCGHCGTVADFVTGEVAWPSQKGASKIHIYWCSSCQAHCLTSGVRPLGTPANEQLHEDRKEVQRLLTELADEKAYRKNLLLANTLTDATEWMATALKIEKFEANRLTNDEARRAIDILSKYIRRR